jgi:radical SAM protein with 4Fe4S-binding SPASM domain
MLSFFSKPITFSEATKKIADYFNISSSAVAKLLEPLVCSENTYSFDYDGIIQLFPPNIIIDIKNTSVESSEYFPSQFAYDEINLQQERFFKSPYGITFMVNNKCATDCVYCYADKKTKSSVLPIDKIENIIKEAFKLETISFNVVGGEFFLYENWKSMLDILLRHNYKPRLISTKIPLNQKEIDTFAQYGIPLQISFDSMNTNSLKQILNVGSTYLDKIKKTITSLDTAGINFQVATVLTKFNDDITTLSELYDYLKQFGNLQRWEIRVGFKSLYSREEFEYIKIQKEKINIIDKWVKSKITEKKVNILWSADVSNKYFKTAKGSKYFEGSRCSANYSHMVVLPDGKVTICEQLYWNPRFIIGDLTTQTIEEVWNSPRALELAFPKKESFKDESICKKCSIFADCYEYHNKCYVDVIKGYGDENWDYPDPRCKFAPEFIYNLNPE